MKLSIEESKIDTPEILSLVHDYIRARAMAATQEERVKPIRAKILEEYPVFADLDEGQRITDFFDLYLTSDNDTCEKIYAAYDAELRQCGIKPQNMDAGKCPALVAKHILTKAESALIDGSGKPFGVSAHKILCTDNGMETWKKWIDLVCSYVCNLPHFKTPSINQ